MDGTADETWAACQKLEKSLMKLLKSPTAAMSEDIEISSELESLKRTQVTIFLAF